jgi:hypothetical protein
MIMSFEGISSPLIVFFKIVKTLVRMFYACFWVYFILIIFNPNYSTCFYNTLEGHYVKTFELVTLVQFLILQTWKNQTLVT